ncbi:MAG TPA: hypothetical protein VKJ00_03980, partial [Thermoanaerobaculia bacterium]|nr:hypothetical protein [Thermoanaerobaculia bacterium]
MRGSGRGRFVIAALACLCAAARLFAQPRPDRPCLTTPGAGATINNCTPTPGTPTPTFTSTPTLSPSHTGTPT